MASRGSHVGGDDGNGDGDDAMSSLDFLATSPPSNGPGSPSPFTPPPLGLSSSNSLYGLDFVNSARHSASSSAGGSDAPAQTKTIQIRAAETNSFPLAQGSNENVINHQDDDQQQQEGEEEEELLFSPSVVSATPSEMTTPLSTSGAAPLPSLSPLLLTNPESVSFASRTSRRPHRPPRVPSNMRFIGGGGGGRSVDAAGSTTPTSRGILQPQPSRHTRAWSYGSYGDSSLMSSLTDSSFEQQQQVPTNNLQMDNYSSNNKVYGMDFLGVPSSLQQPILYEGPSSRLAQRSTLTSNHHHHDSLQEPILNGEINRTPTKESSRREESGVHDVGKRSDERVPPTLKQLHQGVSSSEATSGGGGSINAKMQSSRLLFNELLLEHHGEFEAEAEAHILIALEQEAGQSNEVNVQETPCRPRTPDLVVKDRSESNGQKRPEVAPDTTTIRPGLAATATKEAACGPTKEQPELAYRVSEFLALQKALAEKIPSDGSDGVKVVGANHQSEAQHAGDFLVENYGRLWKTARQSRQRRRHVRGASHQTVAPLTYGTISEQLQTEKSSLRCSEEENAVPLDAAEEGRSVLSPAKYAHKVGTAAKETHHANELRSDWEHFDEFMRLRQISWWDMIARALVVMLLSVVIAAGLFYGAGNPPTGTRENRDNPDSSLASASWWLIFIGVRHNFALLLAQGIELLLVDFFALSSPFFVGLVGPRISLLIASSKGWPGVLFLYSFISMVTLYGHDRFSCHWLFWQDSIDLFNDNNPCGDVTARSIYARWLILFAVVSFLVSAKRLWMGHHLGRRLVSRYKEEVTSLVDKMTAIGELASLALNSPHLQDGGKSSEAKQGDSTEAWTLLKPRDKVKDQNADVGNGGSLDSSRPELMDLLDDWSEPDQKERDQLTSDTSQEILEFHQAYMLIVSECPFSLAFGSVESRAACLQSSSQLFDRLVSSRSSGEDLLLFDSLNSASARSRKAMDGERMKKLLKIFRPSRSGMLNRLDFIRSIDKVYRDLRTLAANIDNSTVLDKAYGRICDVVFYTLLSVVSLPIVGIDPLAITVSVISVLATFAFMIGSASSSFFEGVLLILVRRPFDIGDKIAVSDVETEPNGDGSNGWLVENIDLFTTTVRYGMTAERATIANGTLARCRIINMKRSEFAEVRIRLKFGVEIPFQKIKLFRRAVERFVRERNQEWIGVTSFRLTAIQSDLGFVEYVLVLQSRDSWQQSLSVLESKAAVSSFCLELQKKLDMRYVAPPLPVNLDVGVQAENSRTARQRNDGGRSLAKGMEEERMVGVGGEGALAEGIASLARLFETKKDK